MRFNEKLQKMRKEKGMSQESLAEVLGVSRQAISKWESGQSYPEMENLITLSQLFGVTIDSFVKDGDVQDDRQNSYSEPYWLNRGNFYEYKSQRTVKGVPLVHINIGRGRREAKGIIAVGNTAKGVVAVGLASLGLVSVGLCNVGLISIGLVSVGLLLSIGTLSVGAISIGAAAVGVFALGAVATGMFSFGALSVASHVAIGYSATGHVAVGKVVNGVKTFVDTSSPYGSFRLPSASIDANEVRRAIELEFPYLWKWVVRLVTFFL